MRYIIVLQEHWLWPYDLSSLSSIHPQYDFTAVSDKRLHSGSDLERGCGGVALIWKKALPCIPFQLLTATEFVGFAFSYQVQRATLSAASQSWGSICLVLINLKICLETVEHAVSQFTDDGPLLVVGDFNAHLGSKDPDTPQTCNPRGRQWLSLIDSLSLHNVSLSSLSTGPSYTYTSGGHTTTIDYNAWK